jgi:transposase-like protein
MLTLDSLTLLYVRALLFKHDGNVTAVARIMGVDRRTLYRWIDRWEVAGKPAVRGHKVNREIAAQDLETFTVLSS